MKYTNYTREFWDYLNSLNLAKIIDCSRSPIESQNVIYFNKWGVGVGWTLKVLEYKTISHVEFLKALQDQFGTKELDFTIAGHKVTLSQAGIKVGCKELSFEQFDKIRFAVHCGDLKDFCLCTTYSEEFLEYLKTLKLKIDFYDHQESAGNNYILARPEYGFYVACSTWYPELFDVEALSHSEFLEKINNLKTKEVTIQTTDGSVTVGDEITFHSNDYTARISNEEFDKLIAAVRDFGK